MSLSLSSRLAALRTVLHQEQLDGLIVTRADEFMGEYVPPAHERLAFITGFTGSAGMAVILRDTAAFFTDGRYTVQAREEVDAAEFSIFSTSEQQSPTPTLQPMAWIEQHLPMRGRLGIFAWAHTPESLEDRNGRKGLRSTVAAKQGEIVFLGHHPIDTIWTDRPPLTAAPAVPHPLRFSGVESTEKRKALSVNLQAAGARALAVTLPEEVCWLLNIRGADVPFTPFVLSYALAYNDSSVDWFVDPVQVTEDVRAWLGPHVRLFPVRAFGGAVRGLARQRDKIWIDPRNAPVQVVRMVEEEGGILHLASSPLQMTKALKNKTEQAGMIAAHVRDGAALTRFLARLANPAQVAAWNEISAADNLAALRAEEGLFKGLSFDTISGAGAHGAIVHYRATPESCRPLNDGPIYLLDSGAQYLDGTTDVTRTVAVDPAHVTAEMRDRFTRVLKGHIDVARSVFPEGTTGTVFDEKARAPLKAIGLDYAHGTGHGVGSYLSVHEGPCNLSPLSTVALAPGMVVSNEPGYYHVGAYGIRIENLVMVQETGQRDAQGQKLLSFRTLTLAPIDRQLIDPDLLDEDQKAWLNAYHETVRQALSPLLKDRDPAAFAFLQAATAGL